MKPLSPFLRWLALTLVLVALAPARAVAADDALKIVAYEVQGSKNISDEVVLLSVESRVGDVYTKELIDRDVEALRKLGYFYYVSAEAVPARDGLKVVFKVYENPVVQGVEVQGNTLVPTDKILECIKLESGVTLNLPHVHDAILKINKLYQDKGYSYCGILSQDQIEVDKDSGKLIFHIAEPKLRNSSVQGARKTRHYVILRELETKRGQVVKTEKMRRSLRNVFNLQFFEDVQPPKPRLSDDREFVDLELTVKEQKTGQASFGGGYSSVNGMIGFIDVAETNLGGRGQTLRARLQFGGEKRYQLEFYEPYFRGTSMSLGASIFDSAYEREEVRDGVALSRFEEGRMGYSLRTGWKAGKDARLGARFTHEQIDCKAVAMANGVTTLPLDLLELDTDGNQEVEYTQQTFTLSWTKDARNNVLAASEGYRVGLTASQTGGFLEGINGFQQYTADWRQYFKLKVLGRGTSFAYRLKWGTTNVTNGKLRFIDRFSLGGGETLRGFEDHELTGSKMFFGNLELRKDLAKMIGITLFHDFGDAYGMDGHDFTMRHANGIGLRLNTPIGPFRLDYAVADGRDGRIHFGIGQQF